MTEKQAQHYRRATPIGVWSTFFSTIGGFGLIGFLIWHGVEGMEQSIKSISDKNDSHYKSIYQKIDQVSQRESSDVLVVTQSEKNDVLMLTEKVYGCCGLQEGRNQGGNYGHAS